jgi:NAD(P)H-flavin reductase
VPDGEVSSYLVGDARPGDSLEVLGPVGGWAGAWRPPMNQGRVQR